MPRSPQTAFIDVKRLARYSLIISLSSDPVPRKNCPGMKEVANLYLSGRGVHKLTGLALKRPIACDRAEISVKLRTEAYVMPVNRL
jgi:hypothetical protein